MGATGGTENIMGISHIGHPITHTFIYSVFESLLAIFYRDYLGTQIFHPEYIGTLTGNIHRTHINFAVKTKLGRHSRSSKTMLPRASLSNNTLLAQSLSQQPLPHHIIDLMRTGVIKVITLNIDLRTTQLTAKILQIGHRRGSARVIL